MKLRIVCKSKIHRAVVTGADVDYVGSIGVDQELLRGSDIIEGEQVSVWNCNTGARIEPYAIPLPHGSRQVVLNGAALCLTDEPVTPG